LEKAIGRSTALADLRRLDADDADWNPELASQHSVIPAKAGIQSENADLDPRDYTRMTDKEIYKIEHFLYRFPEVVMRASQEKSPHYIVSYLMELASSFNGFYANNKIIEAGEESEYRLGITQAVHSILWNGLYLLGIRVPERM
jgi:arginyl-tRNA synthetase